MDHGAGQLCRQGRCDKAAGDADATDNGGPTDPGPADTSDFLLGPRQLLHVRVPEDRHQRPVLSRLLQLV